jgi:EpsD family peptidyl-prolyl cis-trans isomerase
MKSARTMMLAPLALLVGLSACDQAAKAPEGQVVATVDGKEVTIHEMNAELAQLQNRGNAPRKLLESVALARVIERKMLAEEARKRNLDKNPQFLLIKQRADESLLVQALQADVQAKVQPTTREGAQKFVSENPQIFGDRKIFSLDQIAFLQPANFDQLPLKQAKNMAAVERMLIDANIEYRRAPQQLDSLTLNPKLTDEIVRLTNASNPEPFMYADQPQGAPAPVIYINGVTGTKAQPFAGERAIAFAQQILQRQEVQKRLSTELKKWQEAYKAKTTYGKGYGPPVLPKPGAQAGAGPGAAGAGAGGAAASGTGATAKPAG